jgi:uncharacterized protein (DUF1330 family)
MPKGYWIVSYRSVSDPAAVSRYAARAPGVITGGGGRILARGMPARVYEKAQALRCVVVEFDSVDQAIATYESPAYQEVLSLLQGAAERDVRMVEGA